MYRVWVRVRVLLFSISAIEFRVRVLRFKAKALELRASGIFQVPCAIRR